MQGVHLTIQPEVGGHNRLSKIRFARQKFSRESADAWWHENKHWLAQKFALRGSADMSPKHQSHVHYSRNSSGALRMSGQLSQQLSQQGISRFAPALHHSEQISTD